jgi:formylglycine-generating enzyme required for sulfatase activity
MWPWGDESRAENAHINKQGRPYFTAAGAVATDRSPYGLFDMAGNAAEWVDTLYEPYPGNRVADLDYSRKLRVVRGGCVLCRISETRSTYRGHFEPQPDPDRLSKSVIGFRCAISAADEKLKAQLASYR